MAADKEPSKTDYSALFLTIKDDWVRPDMDALNPWRVRAKRNQEFVTPWGQWDPKDAEVLRDQQRPVTAFNETNKYIRAICGIEVNNRLQTTYIPREPTNPDEVKANELLTQASEWMDETSDASRHESRVFRDAVVCGVGAAEASLSYDEDPQGLYVFERINPLECGWDRDASEQNITDSKRRWRVREMSLKQARALIPGVTDSKKILDEDLDAAWAADARSRDPKTREEKEKRLDSRLDDSHDPKRKVHIVQVQWWEYETYVRTVDTSGVKPHLEMSPAEFDAYQAQETQLTGIELPKAMLRRKVYKQAFVGNKVLHCGPAPRPDGFTLLFMTAEPADDGTFYSMVDLVKDVQDWSNKLFSQFLHMVNTTAKGGILIESDAVDDVAEFQKSYARPQAATVLRPGSVAKGKVMAKPGTAITSGVAQLLEYTKSMFSSVLGINLELMGQADRDQPGVLEAQRKQSAMTLLATLFDSRSLFKKEIGRTKLHFIQKFLADDRWIRIDSKDGPKARQLTQRDVAGKYDTIVGDAPSAPDTKERAWMALQPILPFFIEQGKMTPELAGEIIDFIPGLPSKLTEAMKRAVTQPNPGAEEQARIASEGAQAQIDKDKGSAVQSQTAAVLNLAKATKENMQAQALQHEDLIRKVMKEMGFDQQRKNADDAEIIGSSAAPVPDGRPLPNLEDVAPSAPPADAGLIPPGGLNGRF